MNDRNGFVISDRDRVLRAWENSLELVRDYKAYSEELKDDKRLSNLFDEFAKDVAYHASKLLKLLQEYEKEKEKR
ncbi:MAG TPA: rubrerythrin [Oscillospiraceae bacterium]|nr:rubrerythrin [Oscillospiraceae bacterium]